MNSGIPGKMLRFVVLFQSRSISVVHEIGKQDDMLMWLMSEAKGVERSLDGLARRLLFLNFASIQTISAVRHSTA